MKDINVSEFVNYDYFQTAIIISTDLHYYLVTLFKDITWQLLKLLLSSTFAYYSNIIAPENIVIYLSVPGEVSNL